MGVFYARSTGGFYDSAKHGARTLTIVDPSWKRPTVKAPDPRWVQTEGGGASAAPLIDVPDSAAIAPTISVLNPACQIPADAVEITSEFHAELLAAQSGGKVIRAGEDGKPVAVDPPPPPLDSLKAEQAKILADTMAELEAEQHRATREALNALLAGLPAAEIAVTPAGKRLAAVDAEIAVMRGKLAAVEAAKDAGELDVIARSM